MKVEEHDRLPTREFCTLSVNTIIPLSRDLLYVKQSNIGIPPVLQRATSPVTSLMYTPELGYRDECERRAR